MDNVDYAQKTIDLHLKYALKNHQEITLKSRATCLNCDEPLKRKIFCDDDCRNDYEKRQKCQNMK